VEDKIQAELLDHIRLLHLEHEAEIKFFEINIASKSLNEKRDLGVCWHPVVVKDQGFSIGDYAYLIVERTKDIDKVHQFKAGNVVSVGIWKMGSKKDTIKGVIDYIHKNKMKIILYSKDLPEWISDGGIGVDLLIDERTFREMEFSTKQVMNADPKSRLAHLRNVLMGYKEAQSNINTIFHPGQLQGLNQAQINAIQKVNCSSDITVIHGPPGTGKTTTLVHAIKYLLNQNRLLKNISLCAK
jgi:ATP-dependent RNA/DNA helicase IGHMBP2